MVEVVVQYTYGCRVACCQVSSLKVGAFSRKKSSFIVDRAIAPQAKRDLRFGAAQQLVGTVSQCVVLEIGMGESVNPGTQTTYFVLLLLVGPGIDALGMTGKLI